MKSFHIYNSPLSVAQLWRINIFYKNCFSRFKGTVSRDGYFFEGPNIWISTFFVCADSFQGLSKAFHYLVQLLTFYLLLWNHLLILKKANWNLSQNSLLCDWRMFPCADLSLAVGKMRKNELVASCMILQNHRRRSVCIKCQNCPFRVFEAGYMKDLSKFVSNFRI